MSSVIFTFFKIFSGCQKGRHTVLYLSCYILNDVFYVFHLCEPFDVGAGEEEPVLYVAEYGVCEGLCDAVFRFGRIAYGDLLPLRSEGHPYRPERRRIHSFR